MPKKKSLWKRETPCLACETPMDNYQFMTKSQTIIYDEWMVPHTQAVSGYEEYPDVLKTTVCPGCLGASNEYNYGVESYIYFYRNPRKNKLLKEYYLKTMDDRFNLLAEEFARFEQESAHLDKQNKRPANTRARATFEKIWEHKDEYGEPFFSLMFSEPRDYVTAIIAFALDRYCQYLRICFNNDLEPGDWQYSSIKQLVEDHFSENTLGMKSSEPRFYFLGVNYLQTIQFVKELLNIVAPNDENKFDDLLEEYWKDAYRMFQFCMDNDDIGSIPFELKDGGMNLLMAKLHLRYDKEEEAKKCLRICKNYADNRLKRISSQTQQNFVNEVDDLYKKYFETEEETENSTAE